MKRFIWLFAFAILLHLKHTAASILDTTFNPGTGADGIVEQVLPMADGRILICGNFLNFNGRSHPYIARLNSNGSLDETFYGQASYWVRHMSLQSDGKIVIGGFFKGVQGVPRSLIARLNSDGSLDTSFDPGLGCADSLGTAIDGNPDPFVFWTEIQPDGKIIATGSFRNYNGAPSSGVVRINPNGSRDPTFNVGSGLDSWGRHIELLPNGQVLLSGWFNSYNNHSFNRLARINADGSPDTSFNPFFGDRTSIYATAFVNNKYVVSGHSLNYDGLFTRETERLNLDGSVDSSYVAYSNEKTESIAVQPDGKIIIGGYFTAVDGVARASVARLFSDGTLDNSFQASIDNYVWSCVLDKDGKLMIGGGFYTVDGVARNGVARLITGAGAGTPPPVAPVLSATANSSSQITVTWSDSATDHSGYSLERKAGSAGTYAAIATLTSSARSYLNDGLAPGTQYFYRLRATTTSGAIVYSNEASVTTSGAPTGGTATASFAGADTSTQGNWKGVYGSEGCIVFSDVSSAPGYVGVTGLNKSDWIWQYSTTDMRASQKVNSSSDRLAACWYASSGYSIDLVFTDGLKHRTSLYLLDWDSAGRAETVQVIDADTGAVLNTQNVSGFSAGVYLTWDLSGHIRVNITANAGNAVASGIFFGASSGTTQPTVATPSISPAGGTFTTAQTVRISDATHGAEIRFTLDGTEPTASSTLYSGPFTVSASTTVKAKGFRSAVLASATASATFTISSGGGGGTSSGGNFVFIGSDAATQGNWIGKYGADGYSIMPNTAKYPAYAQVNGLVKTDWTWNSTTTDTRGLQTPGSSSRTAGCWYSSSPFTIDVKFTDSATHRLALYLCDWDFAGRAETVELLDGDTGAVLQTQTISGFSGGRYLIWDLKGHLQVRVTKTAGPNAIVNGIFFGAPAKQL